MVNFLWNLAFTWPFFIFRDQATLIQCSCLNRATALGAWESVNCQLAMVTDGRRNKESLKQIAYNFFIYYIVVQSEIQVISFCIYSKSRSKLSSILRGKYTNLEIKVVNVKQNLYIVNWCKPPYLEFDKTNLVGWKENHRRWCSCFSLVAFTVASYDTRTYVWIDKKIFHFYIKEQTELSAYFLHYWPLKGSHSI